jgi:hypothetical protein
MKWQVPIRYLLLGLIALFIIAGLAVAAVAQRPRVDPQQPPATAWAGERVQTIEIPQLTEEERARVVSIATGDEQLQRLLDGCQYSITSVGVWRTRSLEKIGGGVILTLADPATLEGDWPIIEYNDREDTWPLYKSHLVPLVYTEVEQLAILVDLQEGQVVQILPGPGAKMKQLQ